MFVVGAMAQALLELPLGLTERSRKLGKLGASEDEQNDEQNDEQFRCSEVGHGTSVSDYAKVRTMLECVVNISEGRRAHLVDSIARAAGPDLLDVHTDAHHNRSVLTMLGEDAPRAVARRAVDLLDLRRHTGAHPRIGVIDVVPFVALDGSSHADARAARDRFAKWADLELDVPVFVYDEGGPTLPEVRRTAFVTLRPTLGALQPHPTAGAIAVGARDVLVAYNLWLANPDMALARSIASDLRGPSVRALAMRIGDAVQVSMNLIDPLVVGPAAVHDFVASQTPITRAELVGLVPRAVLDAVDPSRWAELDLGPHRTIEMRATEAGQTDVPSSTSHTEVPRRLGIGVQN